MFSLAITNYNRTIDIENILQENHNDSRINEIIISDDCSTDETVRFIKNLQLRFSKLKQITHFKNVGAYINKIQAVSYCKNDWVILLDSDNNINSEYIDCCEKSKLNTNTIYAPTFAKPMFDFPGLYNVTLSSLDDIKSELDKNSLAIQIALNTGNYLVPKHNYINIASKYMNIKYTEVFSLAVAWLEHNNNIHFVEGMTYTHKVHHGFYEQEKENHDQTNKQLLEYILLKKQRPF